MEELAAWQEDQEVVKAAVQLGVVEIVYGSVIHVLHLPFGGHLLSLNQGRVLVQGTNALRAARQSKRAVIRRSIEVSSVTALMKSLSPAGMRLGPMLSIVMQGILYSGGVFIGGLGLFGETLGVVLLSSWAFIQPFLSLFIFFGTDLFQALQFFYIKSNSFANAGNWIFGSWIATVIIKMVLAVSLPWFYRKSLGGSVVPPRIPEKLKWIKPMKHHPAPKTAKELWRQIAQDLLRPLFLLSMLLMGVFFYWNEASIAHTVWMLLRPLAIAVLTFYMIRSPRVAAWIIRRSHNSKWLQRLVRLARLSKAELMAQTNGTLPKSDSHTE